MYGAGILYAYLWEGTTPNHCPHVSELVSGSKIQGGPQHIPGKESLDDHFIFGNLHSLYDWNAILQKLEIWFL